MVRERMEEKENGCVGQVREGLSGKEQVCSGDGKVKEGRQCGRGRCSVNKEREVHKIPKDEVIWKEAVRHVLVV